MPPVDGSGNLSEVNFGFWNGGTQTTPVTLAYFLATGGGGYVSFEWATATETGNVGFNLYVKHRGAWKRLNEKPIPSKMIDSLERQTYGYEAQGVKGSVFAIEDLDILGRKRMRGPFALGKAYGRARTGVRAIDWESIRAKSEAKREARTRGKREKMERKLKRQLRRSELEDTSMSLEY